MISARDYAETIVPLIEGKLAAHPKLRLLYRIGPEFEAYTPGAIWSDALVGVKHLTALQPRRGRLRHRLDPPRAARLFAPLIPAEVHVFGDDELAEAKAWVSA